MLPIFLTMVYFKKLERLYLGIIIELKISEMTYFTLLILSHSLLLGETATEKSLRNSDLTISATAGLKKKKKLANTMPKQSIYTCENLKYMMLSTAGLYKSKHSQICII